MVERDFHAQLADAGNISAAALLVAASIQARETQRREWVSRKELAAHFGLSLQVIDSLIRRRVFPHIRIPGTRRLIFSISACEKSLQNFEVKAITH
jgi:hypothetical protein